MGHLELLAPGRGTPAWNSQSPHLVPGGGGEHLLRPALGFVTENFWKGQVSTPFERLSQPRRLGSFSQRWRLPYEKRIGAQCRCLGDPRPVFPFVITAALLTSSPLSSVMGFQWLPFIIPPSALLDALFHTPLRQMGSEQL